VDSLAAALAGLRREAFDARVLRAHAAQFDVAVFQRRLRAFVEAHYAQ
jgi:hypothetical protein